MTEQIEEDVMKEIIKEINEEIMKYPRKVTSKKQIEDTSSDLVTTSQAAKIIGCSDSTIRKWIYKGILRAKKFGKTYVIPMKDVEIAKWLFQKGLPIKLLPELRKKWK